MKYAFSSRATPQASYDAMLALARDRGYQGIELCLNVDHAHGIELDSDVAALHAAKARATAAGVAIAAISAPCSFTNPATHRDDAAHCMRYLDLAAAIGAHTLCVTGGINYPGVSRGLAVDLLLEALGALAIRATRYGVKICLQTEGYWSDPTYATEVVKYVDDAAVRLCWDVFPTMSESDATLDVIFRQIRPWLAYLHVRDGLLDTGAPAHLSYGDINYARVLELLLEAKYQGYISVDWPDMQPDDKTLARDLAILKTYERDAQASY